MYGKPILAMLVLYQGGSFMLRFIVFDSFILFFHYAVRNICYSEMYVVCLRDL